MYILFIIYTKFNMRYGLGYISIDSYWSKKEIHYCWWKNSCISWYGKYPIIYKVLYILSGAGFLPSTVWYIFLHQDLCPRSNFPDSMDQVEMQRNLEMQQQLQQILQHPGFQARGKKL